jgi:hypothetical protein
MNWFYLLAGSGIGVCFVVAGLQWVWSWRHRRMMSLTDQPAWILLLMLVPAVGVTLAGLRPDTYGWMPLPSLAPPFVAGLWLRKKHRSRDDLPPALVRIEALPVNPFVTLRHPIRTGQATWAAFGHPIRSRRETRAWLAERQHRTEA